MRRHDATPRRACGRRRPHAGNAPKPPIPARALARGRRAPRRGPRPHSVTLTAACAGARATAPDDEAPARQPYSQAAQDPAPAKLRANRRHLRNGGEHLEHASAAARRRRGGRSGGGFRSVTRSLRVPTLRRRSTARSACRLGCTVSRAVSTPTVDGCCRRCRRRPVVARRRPLKRRGRRRLEVLLARRRGPPRGSTATAVLDPCRLPFTADGGRAPRRSSTPVVDERRSSCVVVDRTAVVVVDGVPAEVAR